MRLALLALAAWCFWQRYRFLAASPYPVGVDGYFYAIQLRALLAEGSLFYPSAPLAFWLMGPLAALSDPVTGAKLGAALGGALAVLPAHALGRRIGGSRAAGLLAAVLIASSATSFYLTTEFVKNSIGLTLALTYACALAWALDARAAPAARARALVAALLFAATAATHKLAMVVAVLVSVPPLAVAAAGAFAASRGQLGPLRPLLAALGAAVALVLAWAALAPGRLASPADLRLLAGALGGAWDVSLPALRVPGNAPLLFQHEVAIAGLLAVLALGLYAARARLPRLRLADHPATDRALVIGPALLAVLAALPFLDVSDPQGLAFRLRLIAFVPLSLCAAAVAGALTASLAPRWRAAVLVPFALAFLAARPATPDEGVVRVHPAMQAAVRALHGVVPDEHVIIVPERHIAFMVAWYTRSQVRLRPEPVPPARRWRLLPMAHMSPALREALQRARDDAPAGLPRPRSLHPRHPDGLVLMPEATWQWILDQMPPAARAPYDRWITI